MKKFFFRLETLLKIRKVREGSIMRDLAHSRNKMNHIEEKEQTLKKQIRTLMDEIQAKRDEKKLTLEETYQQILAHLNTSLEQVQAALLAQTRQLEVHQENLKRAIQERKVIEKIKEKHYATWHNRISEKEGDLIDEIGLNHSFKR